MHSQNAPSPFDTPEDFQCLYEKSHLNVYRYIYSICNGSQEDVEDLTADTYSRAWHARRKFHGDQQAAIGWLLQIARNLVIDKYRKDKRNGLPLDIEDFQIPAPMQSPEANTIQKQQTQILLEQIQNLANNEQELIILRYLLGWRIKDIGKHLDLLENTVTVKIKRALQKLRHTWPQDPTEGTPDA